MDIQNHNLKIYDKSFENRLILGTALYPNLDIMKDSIIESKSNLVTVSLRRESNQIKNGGVGRVASGPRVVDFKSNMKRRTVLNKIFSQHRNLICCISVIKIGVYFSKFIFIFCDRCTLISFPLNV